MIYEREIKLRTGLAVILSFLCTGPSKGISCMMVTGGRGHRAFGGEDGRDKESNRRRTGKDQETDRISKIRFGKHNHPGWQDSTDR